MSRYRFAARRRALLGAGGFIEASTKIRRARGFSRLISRPTAGSEVAGTKAEKGSGAFCDRHRDSLCHCPLLRQESPQITSVLNSFESRTPGQPSPRTAHL